jgi:two-component system sensor histidine kinase KdpD
MAARVKADLHVAHVASGDVHDRRDIDDLADLRILARDIGAEWTDLHGDHPAQALLEFAREHQITQIVIGPSQRTRWQELLSQGSIVKKIIRLAAISGIDVHIISRPETTPTRKHHIQEGSVGAPAAPSDDGGENGHGRDG